MGNHERPQKREKHRGKPFGLAYCGVSGTPGETRTHYIPLRRRTLYPGEVRRQSAAEQRLRVFQF